MFVTVIHLSQVDLLCISTFLISGVSAVLALRNFKQFLAGCITLPIATLCGMTMHLLTRWLYGETIGTIYGLGAFALSGLLLITLLRWIISLDAY